MIAITARSSIKVNPAVNIDGLVKESLPVFLIFP